MIKKQLRYALTFILFFAADPLSAAETDSSEDVAKINTLEVRGGAVYQVSKRFREVYDTVSSTIQVETSTLLWSPFEIWTNLDWSTKRKKKDECCKTRIKIFNGSVGIKYVHCISKNLDAYIGIGPSLATIELNNHSCCNHETKTKIAFGGIIKSGLRYYMLTNVFLDLFIDYLYQPVHWHHDVDVGGLKSGAGLGVRF